MKKAYKIIGYIILTAGAISMLLPLLYMISLSLSENGEIITGNIKFIPETITGEHYSYVLKSTDILKYFWNSFFVAIATTLGQITFSTMAGYGFARFNFKHKEKLFLLILVSMMIPPQVNIVPLFFLMKEFHWINHYHALIIPGFFGGFGVFMMRQWFKSLPKDLELSAKTDGCSEVEVFLKIALPLAVPAVATLGIFTFITTWNSFMWPLIVTTGDSMQTLPLALAKFKGSFRELTDWGALCAFSVICCLPVIGVFLIGRKYFINDILSGGIKE